MSANEARPKILMVDDEPDFQALVRRWLEPEYETLFLPDGGGLMRVAAEARPAAVIMDVVLPGEDGLELCRRLHADARFKDLPVLFLTGRRDVEDYLKSVCSGGAAYLAKPVGPKQLREALKQLLPEPEFETPGAGD